jgi:hypothetical protein
MVTVTLYTTPGTPRPRSGSTCPQARPTISSQNDGVYPQSLLRLPPEDHVMAQHPGHQNGTSSSVSRALLVPPPPHPMATSLHMEVSPLAAPDGLYNSTSCPRGAKSAHTQNKQQQMVSLSIHQTYALVYQNHSINQNTQVHNIPL